ncbi:MAG: LuxR C-terminal-related transcriptional regulator [Bryobacteraceae bacterium]
MAIGCRELEILELIAQGMSSREIAEKLYVSENTVKTHCSRVFDTRGLSSLMMVAALPLSDKIGFDKAEVLGYTTIVLSFLRCSSASARIATTPIQTDASRPIIDVDELCNTGTEI